MTIQTYIGYLKNASRARLPGKVPRTIPMAAEVPNTVAATIVSSATRSVSNAVSYHCAEEKKLAYQRRDRLFGGKSMYGVPLNEVITITMIGAIRNIISSVHSAQSATRAPFIVPPPLRLSD